jgi:hypothetical protein
LLYSGLAPVSKLLLLVNLNKSYYSCLDWIVSSCSIRVWRLFPAVSFEPCKSFKFAYPFSQTLAVGDVPPVMGMTSWVGQGQSHLPADVSGISTALSQEDRLRPKDRLRQQPAGNFTEESQSRRRRRNSSNGCFAKRGLAPTRSTEAGDKHGANHARSALINGQEPSPQKDPRQNGGHMPWRCRSKGERHFIKLPLSDRELEDGGATPRPWPRRSRQPGSQSPKL